jgi:hypothetical protein
MSAAINLAIRRRERLLYRGLFRRARVRLAQLVEQEPHDPRIAPGREVRQLPRHGLELRDLHGPAADANGGRLEQRRLQLPGKRPDPRRPPGRIAGLAGLEAVGLGWVAVGGVGLGFVGFFGAAGQGCIPSLYRNGYNNPFRNIESMKKFLLCSCRIDLASVVRWRNGCFANAGWKPAVPVEHS